jgi:hypothetical protein
MVIVNVKFEYYDSTDITDPVISVLCDDRYVFDFMQDGSIKNVDENLTLTTEMIDQIKTIGISIKTITGYLREGGKPLKALLQHNDVLYDYIMTLCKMIKDKKCQELNEQWQGKSDNTVNAEPVEKPKKEVRYQHGLTLAVVKVYSDNVNIEFCDIGSPSKPKRSPLCGINIWKLVSSQYHIHKLKETTERKIDYYIKKDIQRFIDQIMNNDKPITDDVIKFYLKPGIDRILRSI